MSTEGVGEIKATQWTFTSALGITFLRCLYCLAWRHFVLGSKRSRIFVRAAAKAAGVKEVGWRRRGGRIRDDVFWIGHRGDDLRVARLHLPMAAAKAALGCYFPHSASILLEVFPRPYPAGSHCHHCHVVSSDSSACLDSALYSLTYLLTYILAYLLTYIIYSPYLWWHESPAPSAQTSHKPPITGSPHLATWTEYVRERGGYPNGLKGPPWAR